MNIIKVTKAPSMTNKNKTKHNSVMDLIVIN